MMTYILLRDNKEKGPYSLDEIRNAGLKPHDLVWVEGQSVCWLNPGEIKELRDHVGQATVKEPVKATAQETVTGAKTDPVITVEEKPLVKEEHERYMPQEDTEPVGSGDEYPTYRVDPDTEIVFPNEKGVYKVKEKEVVAETKYVKPLDEIKELYVRSLEQRIKKKNKFHFVVPPPVKKAMPYAAVLIVGIIAGVLITKPGRKKEIIAAQKTAPANIVTTPAEEQKPLIEPIINDPSYIPPPVTHEPPVTEKVYREVEPGEYTAKKTEKNETAAPVTPGKKAEPEAVAEKEVRSAEEKTNKELSLSEMRTFVSVASNDYIVGSFGGIRNLELTVTNTSKYSLDHVVVELKYLKPRDEFLKAENISFYSIGPNDSKTVSVPRTTRGVKVSYKIIRVESKEISSNTAGL